MDQPSVGLPRYEDHRPYTTVGDLDVLKGPEHGVVELPRYMAWSGLTDFDLDQDDELRILYATVLNEAPKEDDLSRFLNKDVLLRIWPRLWLPAKVRDLWETRFPQLTASTA
jgi:hypothetical protein